jgi:hypothetical protein
MKSFKTKIVIAGAKTEVTIHPNEDGSFGVESPLGKIAPSDITLEELERIQFDIDDLRKAENEEPQTGAMSPKGTKQMERATLNTLLEKLGVTDPARLETERAKKKLGTRLSNKGIPEGIDLSDDEKDIIREVGFGWLPQVGGSGKPADALATASGAPQAGEKPEKGSKPAPKGSKPAKGKPAAAAKGKPANKTSAKVNGTPAERKPRERTGGAAIFVKAFPNKQVTVIKDDLVKEIAAAGVSEASARAYIVWAKREKAGPPNKVLNPFPFFLIEKVNKDGVKVLQRAGEPA